MFGNVRFEEGIFGSDFKFPISKRVFTHFYFGFFFLFLRSTLDVKIMGVCLERREKKEEKAQLLWKENLKKRPRRDSNPRSLRFTTLR